MTGALRSARSSTRERRLAKSGIKLRSSLSMLKNLTGPAMRTCLLLLTIFATCSYALAQVPTPTPTPNPATLPPGTQTNPQTAPPGTQQNPAQAPPGTNVPPTSQPTPITPGVQEPRQPVFPGDQAQPVPPLPDLTRLGIVSSNVLTLSMNDAIRRALQNNNDIEVARDTVRIGEQQLRALYGVYEPIFSMTPQFVRNVTPQQSSLGGSGCATGPSITIDARSRSKRR